MICFLWMLVENLSGDRDIHKSVAHSYIFHRDFNSHNSGLFIDFRMVAEMIRFSTVTITTTGLILLYSL